MTHHGGDHSADDAAAAGTPASDLMSLEGPDEERSLTDPAAPAPGAPLGASPGIDLDEGAADPADGPVYDTAGEGPDGD